MRLLGRPRGYVVCATPRSGSNYLCQFLASTGVLGRPREYFNAVGRRKYDDADYPEDPRLQLDQVVSVGATRNRVYGVKVHAFQLEPLRDELDPFTELPRVGAPSRPTSTAPAMRPRERRPTTGR